MRGQTITATDAASNFIYFGNPAMNFASRRAAIFMVPVMIVGVALYNLAMWVWNLL